MNRDILGFLFVVLAVVIAVLFFVPKVQEVRVISVDKNAKFELTEARRARVEALKQVQAAFAQQSDRIKKISAVLPSEPQIPEVMVSLEAMAREANIALTSVVPQVSTKDKAVFVTMVGQGSLAATEHLSKLIADNGRPMSVRAVSLLKTQDGTAISFTMTIRAPYTDMQTATPTTTSAEEDDL